MEHRLRHTTLEMLVDGQHLYDLLVRYWCAGVDTVNWKLYRAILADEVEMNFPGSSSTMPVVWKSDDWIRFARQIEGFDSTQHCVSNFTYDIHGDTALVTTYLVAEHHLGNEYFTLGGQSTHTFVRAPDSWKMIKASLQPWWTKGNSNLVAKAAERYLDNQAPRSSKAIV